MVKVIVKAKNGPGSRRKTWTRTVKCRDLDHARNYVRKTLEPIWVTYDGERRDANDTVKITVWIDAQTYTVWTRETGWSPIQSK